MHEPSKTYPPRAMVTSFQRVVTAHMNQEMALVVFDALREASRVASVPSADRAAMVEMAGRVEQELLRCGVFGIRAERGLTGT